MRVKKYLNVLAASLIWGGAYPFTMHLVREVSPVTVVTLRTTIGALCLLPIYGPKLDAAGIRFKHMWKILVMSVLGVSFQQNVQAYALKFTSAGHAGWLIVTVPIMVAAVMALLGERFGLPKLAAFALGAFGALLVIFSRGAGSAPAAASVVRGDLIFLASCFSWTCYVILTKKWLAFWPQTRVTAVTMLTAAVTMLSVWLLSGRAGEIASISPKGWACAVYLGVLSSALAYTLWNDSVEKIGPVISAYFIYAQPFAAAVSAYLFLGERPAAGAFAGGLFIMAGVYFVNLRAARPAAGDT